ncbi:hypothetical protein ElyMa_005502500 [Elysia marginata]|uniref:Uncharacterized protein n=1 Tax=Elysia marginata TaxID=1093978 RepID=A0AAV4ETB6_9GAST|nr:hypothetical protein ElyMa_005502500 [Elysia marginata]
MCKRITPYASQNTIAITLAADICTFNFFCHGRRWMFPSHGVALCLCGIQMDPSFITSNQIDKKVILCSKVSTRPRTNMRHILISIVLLALQQKAL